MSAWSSVVLPAPLGPISPEVHLKHPARGSRQYPPEKQRYFQKTHRVVVRDEFGKVVAVVEVVSPGNKDRKHSLQTFLDKCIDLLDQQVNFLIIDPFPPGVHDAGGIHQAISAVYSDEPFELSADKPLTFVAYQVSPLLTAHVKPIAVGDPLPEVPLFLRDDQGINVPLEETHQATWRVLPRQICRLLETSD